MEEQKMKKQNNDQNDGSPTRDNLAIGITIASIAGLVLLALFIIIQNSQKDSAADRVFFALLPVFATWVGTILAFYFSKVNFEAAARSQQEVIKQLTPLQKLQSTPVKEKMIAVDKMHVERVLSTMPANQVKLLDILDRLEKAKKGYRIPILGDNDIPKCVIHRSVIDKFIADKARANPPVDPKALSLQDLFDDSVIGKMIQASFGIVREDNTLAEAKATMENIKDCQDVFVTKGGTSTEPVIGWITNNIIQDCSQV